MPIAAWGFAPALAAGNAVVLKPAETTPLTALRLANSPCAPGCPRGCSRRCRARVRVAGARLVEHPDVRKIVFTGSTAVGKKIMERCAAQVKRLTLELGGKSPSVVFADADLERAADPMAFLDNAGQDCCCAHPAAGAARGLRPLPRTPGVRRGVGEGRRPGRSRDRDGPADLRRPTRAGTRLCDFRTPGRGKGFGARRRRLLVPADRTGPVGSPRGRRHRGDLRAGGGGAALRRRGGRSATGQRDAVRPVRLAVDPRPGPRAADGARGRGGQPVGQLAQQRALLDALRRLQAVRPWPGAGTRRAHRVHRDQERLHQHRE